MVHGYQPTMPIETQLVLPRPKQAASEWVKNIHDRAQLLQEAGLTRQIRRAESQAKQHDKGKKMKQIKVGDRVRVDMSPKANPYSKKLSRLWKGPFEVIGKSGPVTFRVMDKDGFESPEPVHINRLQLINDERSLDQQ